ncbi:MAG: hypothetical protein IJV54_09570 [Bacteroidales bacterium]|nr:hypothetical protein [Bacteroidales bacterium]
MPSFVSISAEETANGCLLRCEISSSDNIKSYGFLFGESSSQMTRIEGKKVSERVFEAEARNLSPET